MDLVVAILLCVFVATVIVIGEVYLEMDKHRTRAIEYVKEMNGAFYEWIWFSVEMAEASAPSPAEADELDALLKAYQGCAKYRDNLKIVPIVNSMAALISSFGWASGGTAPGKIQSAWAGIADDIRPLRIEYNQSVRKLNSRLGKRFPALAGKLFRIDRLEELRDFGDFEIG
jgi:hypothetical protein